MPNFMVIDPVIMSDEFLGSKMGHIFKYEAFRIIAAVHTMYDNLTYTSICAKFREFPGLYHISNERALIGLSNTYISSLWKSLEFFRFKPKFEYANEIKEHFLKKSIQREDMSRKSYHCNSNILRHKKVEIRGLIDRK